MNIKKNPKYEKKLNNAIKTLKLSSKKAYNLDIPENTSVESYVKFFIKRYPIINKNFKLYNNFILDLEYGQVPPAIKKTHCFSDDAEKSLETTDKPDFHPITLKCCLNQQQYLALVGTNIPFNIIKETFKKEYYSTWFNLLLIVELLNTCTISSKYMENFLQEVLLAQTEWSHPFPLISEEAFIYNNLCPMEYDLVYKERNALQVISRKAYALNIPEDYNDFHINLLMKRLPLAYKKKEHTNNDDIT